jgi:hypothetical protein
MRHRENPVQRRHSSDAPLIGWREWVGLPSLGVAEIKAKIDTGARSSALHAYDLERFERGGRAFVRFKIHPYQRSTRRCVEAESELRGLRQVRNPGGQVEQRPVIETEITLGGEAWTIELTLTNRDEMGFRMLLGRQALRRRFLINPARSFLIGKPRVHRRKDR